MATKILIIDDEPDMVSNIKEFLEPRGYQTASAQDGEEALKVFENERPDLVLLDLKMPKKDGYEFLKAVRAGGRWVPVVIVSALTDPASIFKGYDFQADYYITKPVNFENLLKAIHIMVSLIPLRRE